MANEPPRYANEPVGELLPVSVKSVLEWARGTDPPPARAEVVDYVKRQWRDGRLETGDVERLAVDYPELAGFE